MVSFRNHHPFRPATIVGIPLLEVTCLGGSSVKLFHPVFNRGNASNVRSSSKSTFPFGSPLLDSRVFFVPD